MKKLNINFDLQSSVSVNEFWNCIHKWLCSPNPLYGEARDVIRKNHKILSSFSEAIDYEFKYVKIEVNHDSSYKSLSIKISEEKAERSRIIDIYLDYYDAPVFFYEEIIDSDDSSKEIIQLPKVLVFIKDLLSPENEMMTVVPVLDSEGRYEKNIETLRLSYSGIAKVQPSTADEIIKENPNISHILSGHSLVLINGNYYSVYKAERIKYLNWYILERSNNRWRNIERKRRNNKKIA